VADGERVPIRLVKENGDTISLDATSIDMMVERDQSAFGIPLADAKKMAIDLNQARVAFEVQGVFTDDPGQEVTSQAKAIVDLASTQSLFDYEAAQIWFAENSGGDKQKTSASNKRLLGGGRPTSMHQPGKRKSQHWLAWHNRYLSFPVAYWVSQNATATGGLPVTSGLNVRFSSSDLSATNMVGGALTHGATVNTWVDSASSIVANKAGSPIYKKHGAGGNPYVYFDGASKFDISYHSNLHPTEKTIFIVANSTNSSVEAEQHVISTREGSDKGWTVRYRFGSNNKIRLSLYNSGADDVSDSTTTLVAGVPQLHTHTVDLQGDGSYKTRLYNRGVLEDDDNNDDYDVVDDDATQIGASSSTDYLTGNIYEIIVYNRVLTFDEQFQVEGYLSNKYNIPIRGYDGGIHAYQHFNFQEDADSVRVVFDAERVASKNEPYGFVNKSRAMTGITVNSTAGYSASSVTFTINTTGGDPRDWMDVTNSSADYHIKIKDPATGTYRGHADTGELLIRVTAVAATSITCEIVTGLGSSLSSSDEIHLAPCKNLGIEFESSLYGGPVLVLPIENAFAEITVATQVMNYVNFPNYQDGSSRTEGASLTSHPMIYGAGIRADEYITHLLSNLLTSTLEISNRAVNAAGNKTLDKVFSTTISNSGDGFATRLEITQVFPTSLGTVNSQIKHNFGVGNLPTLQGFTGGKAGKKVKSAGDKVQDLLGILANSNNFGQASSDVPYIQGFIDFVTTQVVYGERESDDYIMAIQIPYNTNVTKGTNSLDDVVAQRNHFVTTKTTETADKMALANETHASRSYNPAVDGSRKNGINGLVTDFQVHRDAEMKAYEFALKFVAADIII
jgi:hypothetical protein